METLDSKKAFENLTKYFRYLQLPVANKSELWVKHPNGGEYGMFAVETSTARIVVWNKETEDWTYVDQSVNDDIVALLKLKADSNKVYTKDEIDALEKEIKELISGLESAKANKKDVYTTVQVDAAFQKQEEDFTKAIANLYNLNIRKVYPTYAAMFQDLVNNTILGHDKLPILNGQLVMVANPDDISQDGVYLFSVVDSKREWIFAGGVDLAGEVNKKTGKNSFYNVSQAVDNYRFADSETARHAVLAPYRALGSVLAYQLATGKWIVEQYNGANLSHWTDNNFWKLVGVEVVNELGYSEEKAISQKIFTEVVKNRANGGYVSGNYLFLTCDNVEVGEPIELGSLDSIGEILQSINNLTTQLDGIDEAIALKVDDGYIDQEDEETAYLILTSNGEEISRIELPKLGGGGGGSGGTTGVVMKLRAIDGTSLVVGEKEDALIKWNFTSIDSEDGNDTGNGAMTVSVNGVPVYVSPVTQGDGTFNIRNYIALGRNNVKLRIEDSYGNARSISYTVQKASLTLTSTFNDASIYSTEPVTFRYVVTGGGNKTIKFTLNGTELLPETTTASGIQMSKQLTALKNGTNVLRVQATSVLDGALLTSNELYNEIVFAKDGVGSPVITSSFGRDTVKQFETLQIPYFAYDPTNNPATVHMYANNVLIETVQAPRSSQVWEYRVIDSEAVKLELRCGSSSKVFNLIVTASDSGIQEVLSDLEFKVKAVGKSNSSENKDSWSYSTYTTKFNNFNWIEDGWLKDSNGDTALKVTGSAVAEVGIRPFNTNVLTEGLTYTIEYSTSDIANDNAVVIEQFIDGIGIKLTPTSVTINSAEAELSRKVDSSKKISISFVVEKRNSITKLFSVYIDGIFSGVIQYSVNDRFNNSGSDLKISTGNMGALVYVYGIRWYRNNLEDSQILGNYIFDMENPDMQKNLIVRNDIIDDYGNIDYAKALNHVPCLTVIGELPDSKGSIKDVTLIYEDMQNTEKSFVANHVSLDVQGTSSLLLPLKNYKFKFSKTDGLTLTESGEKQLKYTLKNTGTATDVFCTKLDFVDSSGVNNTGLAVIVNEMLQTANILTPAQQSNPAVRNSI